jgi:hypothetical protein
MLGFMPFIQKSIDDYSRLTKEEARHIIELEIISNYLPLLGKLKILEEKIFNRLEEAGFFKEGQGTVYIDLDGSKAYVEKYTYSNTWLSNLSKAKVESEKELQDLRERMMRANRAALEIASKYGTKPEKLYFGLIKKEAKFGYENARKAIEMLSSTGLIQVYVNEIIDTRGVDIQMLVNDSAKTKKETFQDTLDSYAKDSNSIVNLYISKFAKLREELKNSKENIFSLVKEYSLVEIGSSIRINTKYGPVYVGLYENIRYRKEDEKKIEEILIKHRFNKYEFKTIDITKILRRNKAGQNGAAQELENEGYITKIDEKRIEIRKKERKKL